MSEHDNQDQHQRKTSAKLWSSAIHDAPKCIPSPLKCPDFSDLEENQAGEQTQKFRALSESTCKERTSDTHRNFNKEKRQSRPRPSTGSPLKRKRKIVTAIRLTETKSHMIPETPNCSNTSEKGKEKIETVKFLTRPVISHIVNSSSCLSSPASRDDAAPKRSKETFTPSGKKEQRTTRPSRLSLSSSVQSVNLSGSSRRTDANSADGDNVFEDYFSPANSHQKTKGNLMHQPVDKSIHIPFELGSVLKKRKHKSHESTASETNKKKKMKPEENSGKSLQSNTEIEPQSHSHQDVESALGCPITNVTHTANKGRQSTLPFRRTGTRHAKRRRVSTSVSKIMERNASPDRQQTSVNDLFHTMESE